MIDQEAIYYYKATRALDGGGAQQISRGAEALWASMAENRRLYFDQMSAFFFDFCSFLSL